MNYKFKILLIPLLILVSSIACSLSVPAPTGKVQETRTFQISEPLPQSDVPSKLSIDMGAGQLNIQPATDQWVTGEILYNLSEFEPVLTRLADGLQISQKNRLSGNLPVGKPINDWTLKLGNHPTDLSINAGAYQGILDLGGIPLTRLTIEDGASNSKVAFNTPNPVPMQEFNYSTGASIVDITSLSNANFSEMSFSGGAGNYSLDFTGNLKRDATVRIDGGVSNLKLVIPSDKACRVEVSGGLNNITLKGTWTINEHVYSIDKSGPKITVFLDMGVGNLNLVQE